jgi:branched-chain amino acid transport system permease protein
MIAQALVDGIFSGAIAALGAIGVTFSLSILRFANFSHGELLGVGAYGALGVMLLAGVSSAARMLGAPLGPFSFGVLLIIGLACGIAAAVAAALLLERLVYRPLRARAADPLTLVFASFGLALLLRSVILLLFGPDPHQYSTEIQMALRLPGPVLVMPDQILVFGVTLAVLAALWLFLQRSRHGIAMRCVAENPALAGVAGLVLMVGPWTIVWASLVGVAEGGALIVGLMLPALLCRPEDVARTSAGMFTLSYGGALAVGVLSGVVWDVSGRPALAFVPIAACAIVLTAMPIAMRARGELR